MKTAPFRKSKLANRGSGAEDDVKKFLDDWASRSTHREANRLVDTKAAGRVIKAAAADFEFFCEDWSQRSHGLIEVKETEHEYRLSKSRLTQFARLRKRAKCGGRIFVLVYHSKTKLWRCLTDHDLGEISVTGSWDLRTLEARPSPMSALLHADDLWGL